MCWQEGTSDRLLPVSISGARLHGSSVGYRSGCLSRHRVSPGGPSVAAEEMASAASARLLGRLHLACADFMIDQVDPHVEVTCRDLSIGERGVDAGLGERRQQVGCVAVAALLAEWRARGSCVTARLHLNSPEPA